MEALECTCWWGIVGRVLPLVNMPAHDGAGAQGQAVGHLVNGAQLQV